MLVCWFMCTNKGTLLSRSAQKPQMTNFCLNFECSQGTQDFMVRSISSPSPIIFLDHSCAALQHFQQETNLIHHKIFSPNCIFEVKLVDNITLQHVTSIKSIEYSLGLFTDPSACNWCINPLHFPELFL